MITLDEIEAAGGFSLVYVDPPWRYRNGGRGAARNHYVTLADERLAALPVQRLVAKDSVLFCWGTWPALPTCLATIAAWGFEYVTLAFLWVKHYPQTGTPFWGGGFWTCSNNEFCLLARRGNLRRVSASVHQLVETWEEQPDLVLRAPAGQHSAKPVEVRDRIVQLMGDLPRVELFARSVAPGWHAWGDEIESTFKMEW